MSMTKEKVSKLLGRSLTSAESGNFDLYLGIAYQRLEDLLCINLCIKSDKVSYPLREGFRSLYVDPLRRITSVSINGNVQTGFTLMQGDNLYSEWYDTVVLESKMGKGVAEIEADWGFGKCEPYDLQLLTARAFALVSSENSVDTNVKTKKIEDFSVTYGDETAYDSFLRANAPIISKYGKCNLNSVRHGRVRSFC